jgi:hypothetical protein
MRVIPSNQASFAFDVTVLIIQALKLLECLVFKSQTKKPAVFIAGHKGSLLRFALLDRTNPFCQYSHHLTRANGR